MSGAGAGGADIDIGRVGGEADDPFALGGAKGNKIHIRVQQRNGRKSLTTVAGLSSDLDLKKILKYLKKAYSTNGTIIEDAEAGAVIRMFLSNFKCCVQS